MSCKSDGRVFQAAGPETMFAKLDRMTAVKQAACSKAAVVCCLCNIVLCTVIHVAMQSATSSSYRLVDWIRL